MIKNLLLVGFGGFAGSVLRYLTYQYVDKKFLITFPLSTFIVNILGSLILGVLIGLNFKTMGISEQNRLLFAVGFCGSFTTFSTFAVENFNLLQQKEIMLSLSYIALSVSVGLAAVYFGYVLGKSIS